MIYSKFRIWHLNVLCILLHYGLVSILWKHLHFSFSIYSLRVLFSQRPSSPSLSASHVSLLAFQQDSLVPRHVCPSLTVHSLYKFTYLSLQKTIETDVPALREPLSLVGRHNPCIKLFCAFEHSFRIYILQCLPLL